MVPNIAISPGRYYTYKIFHVSDECLFVFGAQTIQIFHCNRCFACNNLFWYDEPLQVIVFFFDFNGLIELYFNIVLLCVNVLDAEPFSKADK